MTPILYSATETAFTSEGLGRLSDAISCVVTEERNGEYELLMEYPVTGALFNQLQHSAVISAAPADGKAPQPFRIYRIEKPIGGICTIYAEHISYQLNSIPVMPFEASGIVNALNGLVTNAAESCPFTVWTNKETAGTYRVIEPTAFRALLGGQEGSILDVFGGGEYEFDKWTVRLYQHRGTDNGVSIRYGKNLTDLNQDENIQSTYTGVCPYWMDSETGNIVTLPEKVVWSANADNFPYKRTKVVSFNEQFQTAPSVNELRTAAQQYIVSNNFGVPSVNLEVSYIDLHSITGGILERVNLCDTVTVVFETLGVSATAKVIKTEYNVLKDRYDEVTIGDAKSSIGEVIDFTVEQVVSENIENEVTQLMKYVDNQTALITGGLGGYVVINQNADGYPNEILIMDTPDKETAVNVIRMNQNGIGFSTNGYDGPFSTAWTIDGTFNADFIGAGRMDGVYIKANTINAAHMTIGDPTNYVTVIEQYPSSMLDEDNPLGATVITANGYVSKGDPTNGILAMSDILANGFAYGDELYYEFDAYAPSAKTVRIAVIGYDAEKNELERFYSEPISITTSSKRFTGSVSMDYAHIDGDGNLVLPMASVSGDTVTLVYGQVDGETIRFTNYMNLWEYYAIVLLDDTSTQLYFNKGVIRKKYGGDLIVSGAISADKIMIGAVSEGKLASSVSSKINTAVSSSANALVAATNAVDTAFGAQSTAETAQSQSAIAKAAADAVAGTMEEITKIEDNVTYIDGGKIYTNSIAARAIASLAVTSDKIAANAIVAGKIASGAVTTDKLDAGAVTAGKIASGAVTVGKLGSDVTGSISEKAIVYYKTTDPPSTGTYRAGDVWIKQVSSGTGGDVMWTYSGSAWVKHDVGTTSIINGCITTDLLAANAVTAAKIAAGAVTASDITTGTMSANRISGGTLKLGGADNGNGVLRIYDSSGIQRGIIDNTGVSVRGTLSGSVTGTTKGYYPDRGTTVTAPTVYEGTVTGTAVKLTMTDTFGTTKTSGQITSRLAALSSTEELNQGLYPLYITAGDRLCFGLSNDVSTLDTNVGALEIRSTYLGYETSGNGVILVNKPTYVRGPIHLGGFSSDDKTIYFSASTTGGYITGNQGQIDVNFGGGSGKFRYEGNEVAVVSSSSRRYKHDIQPLDANLDPHKLLDLPVVQFVYNDGHNLQYADMEGRTLPGFIAEDVDEHYPAAVIHDAEGRIESWDERRILPGMLALIQEQQKRLDEQEKRIEKLEAMLKELIENG